MLSWFCAGEVYSSLRESRRVASGRAIGASCRLDVRVGWNVAEVGVSPRNEGNRCVTLEGRAACADVGDTFPFAPVTFSSSFGFQGE